MRVRWLRSALKSLGDEAEFIATDDPRAAHAIVNRVLLNVALLADQPGLGRPGRVPGTRELVIPGTHYIVPYRVRQDAVEVLRLFHTARRSPSR